jgi:hypothetical protein
VSEIEAELVKLLKFKKHPEDYEDRQKYLTALAEAVDGIKDDTVFDRMTEPAYDWLQDAVEARNKKQGIEDFPDAEPEEVPEEVDNLSDLPLTDPHNPLHRTPAPKTDDDKDNETTEVDEEAPEETAEEEAGEEAIEAAEESDGVGEVLPQPDTETDSTQSGADPTPAKKKRKKHVQAGKYIKKKRGKPDIQPKHKPGKEPNYKAITGKKDRYGITLGTKTAEALKMFEKGCTMRDVVIDQGDTYYNVLRRLEKRGHRIEKLENKVLRLIHKDDLEKKAKGK